MIQIKIPVDWKRLKINQIANIRTGNKDTQNKIKGGQFPFFVRSQNIKRINSFSFDGEAVLTSGDGVGVGKIFHYINGKFDYHQRVYNIHGFSPDIVGKFFFYYFSKHFYRRVMQMSAKNSVDSVRMDMIADMLVPTPSLTEQSRIVSILETWDKALEKLNQKIELKKNIKKGLLQKLMTGKTRLLGFNGEWETVMLGEACKINPNNKHLPKSFVYIDLESVNKGILEKENEIYLEGAPSRAQRLLQKKDVLFQMVRPYQKNNLFFNLEGDYVASTGYAQLRAKGSSQFLYHKVHEENFLNQVLLRCTGSSYPAINSTDLARIKFLMPSIEEQTAIANILTTADEEIFVLEKKQNLLEEQKNYLLNNLVTGKIRTPENLTI